MALTDDGVHPPPAGGTYGYNSFVPPLVGGASYTDPVFGETVRRLTTDHTEDDLYARNMWWNADETRYLHRSRDGTAFPDFWDVIEVATGRVTHTRIPVGSLAADGGFDPVAPDVLYYLLGGDVHQVTLASNGKWTEAVYWSAPGGASLGTLGGTLNWLDASGRYMLVRYGPEPSVHLLDRQNLAAGPYQKPIDGANTIDLGGYVGITPDGRYLVGYDDRKVGTAHSGQGLSLEVDHTSRTVAAAPKGFWSLCGDHGSFLSASDGRNYMVTYNCNTRPEVWRVDITNDAGSLDEDQQRALPNNKLLLTFATWQDFGHVSAVALGDWAFIATEDGEDKFDGGTADPDGNVTPWHPYRQEIIALNVLTGEVRRLAHHRSRSLADDPVHYPSEPRVSASWRGKLVGFASNYNQSGGGTPVADVMRSRSR